MRTFDQWMNEYGDSHRNPTNQLVHKICVPLIMLTIVGFLWALPIPQSFEGIPYLNWATIFVAYCLSFYLFLSLKMFLGMVVQTFVMCLICEYLERKNVLLPFCVIVFALSWIGQFWGHKVEGKRPSFLKDLVFLLIGPLWVTRFLYKKIGINV
jgi:uncharacterized membrane protein YGL010W